jgi:hypothetical protein
MFKTQFGFYDYRAMKRKVKSSVRITLFTSIAANKSGIRKKWKGLADKNGSAGSFVSSFIAVLLKRNS